MSPEFDLAGVEAAIAGTPFAGQVHHFASVESTNTLAIQAAQAGVATGVWVADEQTAGRGRGGHTWHSVAGEGLYVSVLVRPKLTGIDALKISLAAGIAAVDAVEQATGAQVTVRWPNDLMDGTSSGKKLGGILTESAMDGSGALSYAVIGLGLNLNQRSMPEPLRGIATSLRMSQLHKDTLREHVLPLLLRELDQQIRRLEREADSVVPQGQSIFHLFEEYSPMCRGTHVHVAEDGGYTGLTDGLNEHGLLRVLADTGTCQIVRHGGVRQILSKGDQDAHAAGH